jgi:hypothetical protein
MLHLLEPRGEKFRECRILLRTSGYPGALPLVALTIDPDRRSVWYTDGTPAGTSLPDIATTSWTWYLIDLDNGCCFKGTKLDVQKALAHPGIVSGLIAPSPPFSQSA